MKLTLLFCSFLCASAYLSAQVIFPGDLNNDGTADYLDLLPLGVAYGQEGPPRFEASLEWFPQENEPWPAFLPASGVNLGFVDADGNGFIDSLDIEAITLNYDSIQLFAIPPPMPYTLPETLFVTAPPRLTLRFEPPEAVAGEAVRLVLDYIVPDPSLFDADNAPLGIAFVVELPDSLIQDELTEIAPNTALADLMFLAATANTAQFWRSPPPGHIEFAAAGKGVPALAESQVLAELFIVIEDMIFLSQPLTPLLTAPLLINKQEQVIAMETEVAPLKIVSLPLVESNPLGARAFPNPARELLQVELTHPALAELSLFSPAGQRLRHAAFPYGNRFSLETSGLPPGLYFLKIQAGQKVAVLKSVIY